ncbi:MAG: hypothetical protein GX682_03640 [Clostridiaceae bacterium]|nr:hypothetical protein [Clostridiaceae bacterium]
MIMMNIAKIDEQQVNDIVLLVNSRQGKVSKEKKALKIDLSSKTTNEKVEIIKEIRKIKNKE